MTLSPTTKSNGMFAFNRGSWACAAETARSNPKPRKAERITFIEPPPKTAKRRPRQPRVRAIPPVVFVFLIFAWRFKNPRTGEGNAGEMPAGGARGKSFRGFL